MPLIEIENLKQLTDQYFGGEIDLSAEAARYSRQDICDYYRRNVAKLARLVAHMSPAQLAYRLPGAPSGLDMSGDEEHFDTSQIVTHIASGTAFHWWGITRALHHERPQFPKPPEGTPTTGQLKSGMGAGGWSGVPADELVRVLMETANRFLNYIESLPPDTDFAATSRYGVFGTLSAHGWLFLAGMHSAMHLEQVREMRAQPDYPAK